MTVLMVRPRCPHNRPWTALAMCIEQCMLCLMCPSTELVIEPAVELANEPVSMQPVVLRVIFNSLSPDGASLSLRLVSLLVPN